jgi:coenzyme F420 hydrogenase subunit beta
MDFAKSNSAFVLGNGIPMKTVPRIGSTVKDVVDTAGSKYTHGGVLGGLSDAAASFPNGRIGLVALPCELQGLWRMHTSLQATYKFGGSGIVGGRPALTIGLFCSKVYYHDKLVNEFIQQKHAIDPAKVTKTVIKRGKFKVYVGTEVVIEVSLKELESYMSGPCKYCIDYTAELADISIGAIGSKDGWNTVIVRTAVGERLFESAKKANVIEASPVDRSRPDFAPLIRLATKKKLQNNAYYIRRNLDNGR